MSSLDTSALVRLLGCPESSGVTCWQTTGIQPASGYCTMVGKVWISLKRGFAGGAPICVVRQSDGCLAGSCRGESFG